MTAKRHPTNITPYRSTAITIDEKSGLALLEIREFGLGTPVAAQDTERIIATLAELLQVSKQAVGIRLASESLVARA